MANPGHLKRLKDALASGRPADWNVWRWEETFDDGIFGTHPAEVVDLSNTDFRKFTHIGHFDFTRVNLQGACLQQAFLLGAHFRRADLRGIHFERADLRRALFTGADLRGAHLKAAILDGADLAYADLRGADLEGAYRSRTTLVGTKLQGANLNDSVVYGASVWDVETDDSTRQQSLRITPLDGETPEITVDSLEVAQFIYLLLENKHLRHVIDTISSKVVLILGRFAAPHKPVLDAIREQLRTHNLTPVIFDFQGPRSKSVTATVTTLAHMARFIVADITEPKSIPQELTEITHALPSVPIQPILRAGMPEWSMFEDLAQRGIVLDTLRYRGVADMRERVVPKMVKRVQDFIERATAMPKGKAALVDENDELQRANATKDREIARLRKLVGSESVARRITRS